MAFTLKEQRKKVNYIVNVNFDLHCKISQNNLFSRPQREHGSRPRYAMHDRPVEYRWGYERNAHEMEKVDPYLEEMANKSLKVTQSETKKFSSYYPAKFKMDSGIET
jgi:hypothetical protein